MREMGCQVLVCGGGIAGLWAWNRLVSNGFDAILIEREALGGAQTLASQGILHGGQKYSLGGASDGITERLRDQPGRWKRALAGEGGPDLRSAQVLSDHQVMWAAGGVVAKAAALVGVRTLEGQVEPLGDKERPDVFGAAGVKGQVYRLNETVLEVRSVVAALGSSGGAYRASTDQVEVNADGAVERVVLRPEGGAEAVAVRAQAYLFAAGSGNEAAGVALGFPQPATQRRPLKQVMLRGVPWKLYGHGVRASPKPRVTVTSHPDPAGDPGRWVWYLGGNVAEEAAGMSDDEAVRFAAAELEAVFPGIRWGGYEFATWDIDRAEPHTPSGRLPPEPVVTARGNAALAWPTKLVLAPALADRVLDWARALGLEPSGQPAARLPLPAAEVGGYPWELAARWARPGDW
jgi:hypothetical protein